MIKRMSCFWKNTSLNNRVLQVKIHSPDVEVLDTEDFFVDDIWHKIQQLFGDNWDLPDLTDVLQTIICIKACSK
jgi:hypothetical protein